MCLSLKVFRLDLGYRLMFLNVSFTLLFPKFLGIYYLYFVLCCIFLSIVLRVLYGHGGASLPKLVIGLFLLPYYLYLRKQDAVPQGLGPLLSWTVLFVIFLSAVSIV